MEAAAKRRVEIWLRDETRIGQEGILTRVWALLNSRLRIVRPHRYGYCSLYGVACAARQDAVGLVVPKENTD